ncbi:hypothetical protein C4K68_28445 [Pokkaliibacter plantistimulans]|uniref:Uncharacterized protein n=1 Tax=Proteobacteria bacterium 228 TaxID=2083153 RepID=A0A2S5KHH4_9PROT|nr:hypothetical protein [Pokkaliibacter plantistimulans]PPC74043.1 hypothetical protein C4K68_28445 [Pokkaliibacter plantistimulans]
MYQLTCSDLNQQPESFNKLRAVIQTEIQYPASTTLNPRQPAPLLTADKVILCNTLVAWHPRRMGAQFRTIDNDYSLDSIYSLLPRLLPC